VVGSWDADLEDSAAQLLAYFQENGSPMTATTVDGSQTLDIDADGTLEFDNAMTYTISGDVSGIEMIVTQKHTGALTAGWTLDGAVMTFTDYDDSSYSIDNSVSMGGVVSESPITVPESGVDVPTTITCSGDTMTMAPTGSPFVTTWHRL
jgi:hypothetical protein